MTPRWDLVVVLVAPIIAGAALLKTLAPRAPLGALDRVAWTWVLGALATAAFVGVWILTGARPMRLAGALLCLGAAAVSVLAQRRNGAVEAARVAAPKRAFTTPERACFGAAFVCVAAALVDRIVIADASAVTSGDEGVIFAMRAKLLWHAWLDHATALHFEPALRAIHVPDYPLFDPLLQVWAFLVSGRITDVLNRVPIQAFLLAAMVASASRVRAALRPAAAAVAILVWLPSGWLAANWVTAQADVIVACGFLLALEAWRDLAGGGGRPSWRLFACALGVLVWAKHEGLMLTLAVLAGCAAHALRDRCVRRRLADLRAAWLWLALPAAIVAVTWTVNAAGGFASYVMTQGAESRGFLGRVVAQFGEPAGTIARHLVTHVFLDAGASRFLWLGFAAAIVLAPRRAVAAGGLAATAAIVLGCAGYFLVFCGWRSPSGGRSPGEDVAWQITHAAGRVFFHLWPALLVWCARVAAGLVPTLAVEATTQVPEPT